MFKKSLASVLLCTALFSSHVSAETTVIRSSFLHFLNDPTKSENVENSYEYVDDGLLVIEDGHIKTLKAYSDSDISKYHEIKDKRGELIVPGFIDTHIHYPQTQMIAAYGEQLLEWLNTYTFPTEKQFQDKDRAKTISKFFINELLKNGTTSALVFGTVHPESVDALFEEAYDKNMRLIAGKVMMDRNAPDYLLDTAESSYRDTKALIEKWHHHGRLLYAVTPRFAPTSTEEQLEMAGKLKSEFPDVYVHTHLSENKNEIEWVKSLYPEREGYLDVYDHYGLTGNKSIFAHSIHLTDQEWNTFKHTNSVIAFCPTSNLFLGSGLFNLEKAEQNDIRVGLGTDVGAGTSFSQLETLNEAYKVMQLQGKKLSAFKGLYLATLGGAKALSIDDKVGNFTQGKEADFVVLKWAATDLQKLRFQHSTGLEDRLFALMMLGDDRNIDSTYVAGKLAYASNDEL
ncbi:TPA: guanine deaminase [Vibrio parahaemolyticus]|nr:MULTISPECIES: guanine deaminase [Vibrio harveyi group]EJE4166061.1 guanine deaminase [Vibrio parahaemolyticus]EJE4191474.1 guanine deaminase [Vibrio parahaemolyticus]MCI9706494.1 guanine deaminase [Vibrio parahaemolyticus]MDF5032662.1 guanine deaminase [Vibrio parahaemolyticus]MDF5167780.1 guanine deaminase [Vibrio parahaemolyticus]